MNQVVLMGRLTRDPELRHTQQGTAVASFTLAVDREFGGRDGGERQTDFIDCVAWRNTAEFVSKYFTKGQMAAVAGRLQIRDWQDKDGNKRRSAEVIVNNVYFTGSKRDNQGAAPYAQSPYDNSKPEYPTGGGYDRPVTSADFAVLDEEDGELPF